MLPPFLPPSSIMQDLCARLADHVPLIVDRWQVTTADEPWSRLPAGERRGNLDSLLRRMLEAIVCEPPKENAVRECLLEAVTHGRLRRSQGLDWSLMLVEYRTLRATVWEYVRRVASEPDEATFGMLLLDIAFGDATRASTAGFHHDAFRGAERLEDAIERIVRESHLISPP